MLDKGLCNNLRHGLGVIARAGDSTQICGIDGSGMSSKSYCDSCKDGRTGDGANGFIGGDTSPPQLNSWQRSMPEHQLPSR
jgi:hypothetical protein